MGRFSIDRLAVHLALTSLHYLRLLQDKPYALFGTCLGAIVAYEVTKRVAERKHAPMPVALFPAAVSAPHLYAIAVMKLYVQHTVGAPANDAALAGRLIRLFRLCWQALRLLHLLAGLLSTKSFAAAGKQKLGNGKVLFPEQMAKCCSIRIEMPFAREPRPWLLLGIWDEALFILSTLSIV